MNIFLDIETIPSSVDDEEMIRQEVGEGIKAPATMKKAETINDWHNGVGKYAGDKDLAIDTEFRKRSFDAAKGQICSIAWGNDAGNILHCGAYENNQEKDLLKFFFDSILVNCKKNTPRFVGHYVAGFDLKFIWRRAVILGVKPPFPIPFDGRHGKDFFCTQSAWCGFKDTISMDNLAKALGIEGKGDMDGSKVWDEWKSGEFAKVCEYNVQDVEVVREIYKRLTFGEG